MMVEFFYAVITDGAMLGSRRLDKITGFAIVLFTVHRVIIDVFFSDLFGLLPVLDYPRIVCTGAIKAVVASEHEDRAGDTMPLGKVRIGTIPNHSYLDIDYEPSDGDEKIQNLNNRIRFPDHIDNGTIKRVYYSVS